jgi:hypothetical protein
MPYVLLLAESLPARRLPEQGEGEAALFENLPGHNRGASRSERNISLFLSPVTH